MSHPSLSKICLVLGSALASMGACAEPVDMANVKVGLQGLNLHGILYDPIYYKNMPRRLDERGRLVANNELFVQYENPQTSTQWVGMVGQDCYENFASYLAWGKYAPLTQNVNYGFVLGLYYRHARLVSLNGETKDIKEFYTLELGNGNQFVPMPMGTANFHWAINRDLGVGFNVGSNFVVTHFVAFMSWAFDRSLNSLAVK